MLRLDDRASHAHIPPMLKLLARLLAGTVLIALVAIAAGGVWAATQGGPPRGAFVDVGGRRLHVVCAGPAGPGPLIVLEAGASGFSADWAEVQRRLAERGRRSCAYDRAGLGRSDPGPLPRDGAAVSADLHTLLDRLGERGRLVYVGHSMAGLHARVFHARSLGRVRAVVLVDAMTPEAVRTPRMREIAATWRRLAGAGAVLSRFGLYKPFAAFAGDTIGLPPEASREKRRVYGLASHARWTAREVDVAEATAAQAVASGAFPRDLPLAVVTAGLETGSWGQAKRAALAASDRTFHRNVADATHAGLLGREHADAVVDAIVWAAP